MTKKENIKELEKIGYRFIGPNKHSAIKVCNWTRQSLRGKGFCYKQKFYKTIKSHRCIQMSPAIFYCTHRCLFCWRNTKITNPVWIGETDDPNVIMDEAIKAQRNILQGFGGHPKTDKGLFYKALRPRHVAISLAGEPLLYPLISELIEEVKSRDMTAFLVTNGTMPNVLEKISEPTQLYITLPAPDKETYKKTCNPLIRDGWERIIESLSLLTNFSCSTVIRLTLVKNLNMSQPEKYANIIDKANPNFVEVKAFMSVGFSRKRLSYDMMPLHEEIRQFAEIIEKNSGYKIKDEQATSRVVLLTH